MSIALAIAGCSSANGSGDNSAAGNGGAAAVSAMTGGAGAGQSGGAGGATGGSTGVTGGAGAAGTLAIEDSGSAMLPDPAVEMEPLPTLIGDVAISTPSQAFEAALMVELTTTIAGAEIRYTTDGTLPTAASTAHAGAPLSITETTQLRAQAFVGGATSGLVSTAIYIARSFDFESDLPIMIVDGYGGGESTDKDLYLDAAVMLFAPVDGSASLSMLPEVATRAGYHVRGQSSARFPQVPYRLELWDNASEDADYPLLGMPADSDWALIAPYYDRTVIRNPFVYTLARDIGMQAPRSEYVHVFINYDDRALEEDDYQGIYWLTETIKNAAVRTNLQQLEETDTALPAISGGYIFKFDQAASEPPELECTGSAPLSGGFGMPMGGGGTCWVDLEVVDPDPLGAEQAAWLTQHIQELHDTLHETPIGDYAAYIDVASFIDYLIINELTRNVDAYVRSAYFFKDRDGKIQGGPLWDYNFSLAVGGQNSIDPAGGFQYDGSRNVNNWFPKLTDDPAFMDQVRARWQELRQGVLSESDLDDRVTMLSAPLIRSIERDYAKWPVAQVYANPGIVRGPTLETWEEQLQALRDYLTQRVTWIDSQYQ